MQVKSSHARARQSTTLYEESKFNKDLHEDGATSNAMKWRHPSSPNSPDDLSPHSPPAFAQTYLHKQQMKLPPVKTRAIEVGGQGQNVDCESPLSDQGFPLLSPASNKGAGDSLQDRSIKKNRRTGRMIRTQAGRAK